MEAVDKDRDNFITFEELKLFATQNTRDLYKLFKEIDANNDGKLSIDEVCLLVFFLLYKFLGP